MSNSYISCIVDVVALCSLHLALFGPNSTIDEIEQWNKVSSTFKPYCT